jgi:O-antigen/teichoic acid export membrane protein
MNGRIKELLSNTALFTIANMGSKILVFLMVPLYTAVLSTEEYGVADMVQTTSLLLHPVLTCMIAEAVLRFCFIKDMDTSQVFRIGLSISLWGTVICVFLSFVFLYIPFFSSLGEYVLFIPIMFLGHALAQLYHKYSRGIGKVKYSAYAGLLSTVVIIALNLLLLLVFKLGILGYLIAYSLAGYVSALYLAYYCRTEKKQGDSCSDTSVRRLMLKYSIPLVPNSLSWWALSSVNRYIMLAVVGVSAVGIYSATLRIPSILTVLFDIFAQAWLLSALKDYESEETKVFIDSMHGRFFSVTIVMTALFILLCKPMTFVLLSGDFSDYWYITPFLFISVFWGALVGFLGSVFSAERKNTMQFVSTVIGAVVSILVTVVFLKKFGVIIVAIATMIGYFVIWIVRRLAVNKYVSLRLSTFSAVIQGCFLLLESYFVCKSYFILSIITTLLLIALNFKELYSIARFGVTESKAFVTNKLKKNGEISDKR